MGCNDLEYNKLKAVFFISGSFYLTKFQSIIMYFFYSTFFIKTMSFLIILNKRHDSEVRERTDSFYWTWISAQITLNDSFMNWTDPFASVLESTTHWFKWFSQRVSLQFTIHWIHNSDSKWDKNREILRDSVNTRLMAWKKLLMSNLRIYFCKWTSYLAYLTVC